MSKKNVNSLPLTWHFKYLIKTKGEIKVMLKFGKCIFLFFKILYLSA